MFEKYLMNRKYRKFKNRKKTKQARGPETTYVIFNHGTPDQFAECSVCGFEDNDIVFTNLMLADVIYGNCPACKARITKAVFAEGED